MKIQIGVATTKTRRTEIVESYFNEIRKYKSLSFEEEKELAKCKTTASRNKLVQHNLKLVVTIANQFHSVELSDLIEYGNLGLIQSAETYDGSERFATYARHRIIGSILDGINRDAKVVSIPHNVANKDFDQFSIDVEVGNDDGDSVAYSDLMSGDMHVDTNIDSLSTDVARAMKALLSEREANVVCRRMAIGFPFEQSYDEIGNALGISSERARQLYVESLNKLKGAKNLRKY